MVLPRLLFQVALGFWGFFSSPCYAAQQRLDERGEGPPWGGPPRLGDAQPAAHSSDKAAAAERIDAAHASGRDGSSSPAAAAAAVVRNQQQEQQQRAVPGAHSRGYPDTAEAAGKETAPETAGLPSPDVFVDLDMPDLYDIIHTTDSNGHNLSPKSEPPLEPGDEGDAFALLRALTGGAAAKGEGDSLSAAFRSHPALAELFFRGPFSARSPQNPRLKRAVEMQGGRLTSSALTMCGRREQDEDVSPFLSPLWQPTVFSVSVSPSL